MSNPVLTMLVGAPGSGKSTFTQEVVERGSVPADSVVCPDDWRERLTGSRATQTANEYVFRICDTICITRLSYGLDVWLDATNANSDYRRRFLKQIRAVVPDVYVIQVPFYAALGFLQARNAQREHPVPMDILVKMWAQMAFFKPDVDCHVVFPHELSSQVS